MSSTAHDLGTFAILSTIVAALYAVLHALRTLRTRAKSISSELTKSSLPPGPVGLPILGSLSTPFKQFIPLTRLQAATHSSPIIRSSPLTAGPTSMAQCTR